MADDTDELTKIFQSLHQYISKRLDTQDERIANLQSKNQHASEARLQLEIANQVAIRDLKGRIDQLDSVLNGVSGETAQIAEDVADLQTTTQAQDARISRRALTNDFAATKADVG